MASPVAAPRPTAFDLGDLDAASTRSVAKAIDRFVARHSAGDRDDAVVFEDLQLLFRFFERVELLVGDRMRRDEAFDAAVAHRLGECDRCEGHDASSLAAVDELERDGLIVHRRDGWLVAVDRVALRRRLEPILPAASLAYLDALMWDEEHVARMDPVSDPDQIAWALRLWEEVVDAGEPYTTAAYFHVRLVAEEYLGLCIIPDEDRPTRCRIDDRMRASYRRFLAEHTSSRYHAAVAHYFRVAGRRRFAMSTDDAIALRDESLARALP